MIKENELKHNMWGNHSESFGFLTDEELSKITISTSQFTTISISPLSTSSIHSLNTFDINQNDKLIGFTTKYIIAGNYSEYNAFLKRKKFNTEEYKFVYNPSILKGLKNVHGYYVGSWKTRTDIDEIKSAIEDANLY